MTERREPEHAELVELEHVDGGLRLPAKPLAVAGLLLLGVLVVAVGWRPGPNGIFGAATPGPTRAAVAVPTPTAAPRALLSWAWVPVPLAEFGTHLHVVAIWSVGSFLVAELAPELRQAGSVLVRSRDGIDWEDAGFPLERPIILAGTDSDGELSLLTASVDGGVVELYATRDGTAWNHRSVEGLLDPGEEVTEFVRSAAGWVAVVREGDAAGPGRMSLRFSADAARWEHLGAPAAALRGLGGLTTNGRGWVVAAVDPGDLGPLDAWALVSTDGRSWERHPVEGGGAEVNDVSYGVAGYVAVGWDGRRNRGRSWYSADGVAWLPSVVEPLQSMEAAAITHIIAVSDGYLAFSALNGDAWLCPDGVAFWPYPVIDLYDFDGAAAVGALGDVLVAGGWQSTDVPTVWVGSLTEMLASPGGIGVVGSGI